MLISGPPGTGKTLFARTISKESGLPFIFASGAEFTDSEKSGAARINEIFSIARRNVCILVPLDPTHTLMFFSSFVCLTLPRMHCGPIN